MDQKIRPTFLEKPFVSSESLPDFENRFKNCRKPRLSEQNFIYPHYIKIFVNSLFIFLLSPFWISVSKSSVHFKSYWHQKSLCGMAYLLLSLTGFWSVRSQITAKVKDQPDVIFFLFNLIMWALMPFALAKNMWFNQSNIRLVMETPAKSWNWMTSVSGIGLVSIGPLVVATNFCSSLWDKSMEQSWDKFSVFALHGWYIDINGTGPVIFDQLSLGARFLVKITYSLQIYHYLVTVFCPALTLICGIAAFEIASSTLVKCQTWKGNPEAVQDMLHQFATMKVMMGNIDAVNSTCLLILFLQAVAYASWTVTSFMDEEKLTIQIILVQHYLLYFSPLILAAEAYNNGKRTESIIMEQALVKRNFSQFDQNQLIQIQHIKMLIKFSPGHNGLRGGKFFTVTHSLLGVTVSVFLTYALVMVQFKATPKPSEIIP